MRHRVLAGVATGALLLSVQPLAQASDASTTGADSSVAAKKVGKGKRETDRRKTKKLKAKLQLAPRDGATVKTHPVRVTVRTGKRSTVEAARINGTNILRELRSVSPETLRATVSASHGLRHGRNTLKVRILAANGKMRTAKSTFQVAHVRPLAGAGRDLNAAPGATVKLKGTVRSHPSSKGKSVKRTWTLVKAPEQSQIRRITNGPARLRPDVPGTYRVRLTTSQAGKQTSDVMDVHAVTAPMVRINTMDSRNGVPGITVGDTFYPATGQFMSNYWDEGAAQMLFLDRRTLELTRNATYHSCGRDMCIFEPGPRGPTFLDTTPEKLVDEAGPGTLVIASTHPQFGGLTGTKLFNNLGPIGAPPSVGAPVKGGEFSLIGVPGMQRGEGTYSYVSGGSGRIEGYLVKNRWLDFQYTDPRSAEFTTRIGRGCGTAGCGTTFAVNGTQYSNAFLNAAAGYTVDVFEGHTLQHKDRDAFGTNGPNATAEANRMVEFLNGHETTGDVVVINSASNGSQLLIGPQAKGDVAKRLAAAVATVGGTMHRFNTAAITPGQQYTLIGWGDAREGAGEEAIGQNPVIQGRLNPDNASLFKPAAASDQMETNGSLQQVLLQAPGSKDWPESDNPAIAWIGNRTTPKLGSNPRSAYWTQEYDWASVSDSIDRLTWDCPKGVVTHCVQVPGADPGFSEEQFNRAREALSTETSWVSNIRNYMDNFAAPYEKAATKEWEDTQTQAYTKFRAKPDPLAVNPLDVLFTIVDMFEPFAEDIKTYGKKLVKLLAVAATALDFGAMHLDAQEDGSSPDEELQVEADHVADKLRDQAQNTAASFDIMGDLLVSDYAKLAAIGPLAECNGADGDEQACPAEFQWDKNAIAATAAAAQRSAQREIYTELIPVQFPVWTIKRSKYDDSNHFYCTGLIRPFRNVQKAARIAALQEIYPDGSRPKQYDNFTIADVYSRYSVTNLNTKVLEQLFAPVPSSLQVDEDNDGLGLYPQDYARESRADNWPDNAYDCKMSE